MKNLDQLIGEFRASARGKRVDFKLNGNPISSCNFVGKNLVYGRGSLPVAVLNAAR